MAFRVPCKLGVQYKCQGTTFFMLWYKKKSCTCRCELESNGGFTACVLVLSRVISLVDIEEMSAFSVFFFACKRHSFFSYSWVAGPVNERHVVWSNSQQDANHCFLFATCHNRRLTVQFLEGQRLTSSDGRLESHGLTRVTESSRKFEDLRLTPKTCLTNR